jgi:hypothetical protein
VIRDGVCAWMASHNVDRSDWAPVHIQVSYDAAATFSSDTSWSTEDNRSFLLALKRISACLHQYLWPQYLPLLLKQKDNYVSTYFQVILIYITLFKNNMEVKLKYSLIIRQAKIWINRNISARKQTAVFSQDVRFSWQHFWRRFTCSGMQCCVIGCIFCSF